MFLSVRLTGLGSDVSNSDAGRWHRRSESFLGAIKHGDFKETYQRYHPGVTLMWINSFVKQVSFSYQYKTTTHPMTLENADYYPIIHGVSKGVLVFVLAVLLVMQIRCISKLFDNKTSLIYGFMISVEPYLIGINRWFHLTSLEVFLVFTSLLYILVWRKFGGKKILVLSSVLYGLAVLTKTSSLIMLPVFLLIFIKNRSWKDIAVFFIVSLCTFYVLFPAMWVEPVFVIQRLINSIFGAVSEDNRTTLLSSGLSPFYYIVTLILRLSPFTLIIFVASLINRRKYKNFDLSIMTYSIAVHFVLLTLSSQKIDRYIISFIPFILLICSYYISVIDKRSRIVVVTLQLLFLLFVIQKYYPVYSAYYSPVFGGTKSAVRLGVYDNSGEYFAQSAFYLNEEGRDINVYVPNNIDAFKYYYKGNLQNLYSDDTDYVVRSLYMSRSTFVEDRCPIVEKSYGVGTDVVRIYSCD